MTITANTKVQVEIMVTVEVDLDWWAGSEGVEYTSEAVAKDVVSYFSNGVLAKRHNDGLATVTAVEQGEVHTK